METHRFSWKMACIVRECHVVRPRLVCLPSVNLEHSFFHFVYGNDCIQFIQ